MNQQKLKQLTDEKPLSTFNQSEDYITDILSPKSINKIEQVWVLKNAYIYLMAFLNKPT